MKKQIVANYLLYHINMFILETLDQLCKSGPIGPFWGLLITNKSVFQTLVPNFPINPQILSKIVFEVLKSSLEEALMDLFLLGYPFAL